MYLNSKMVRNNFKHSDKNKERDKTRDEILGGLGWTIIRTEG